MVPAIHDSQELTVDGKTENLPEVTQINGMLVSGHIPIDLIVPLFKLLAIAKNLGTLIPLRSRLKADGRIADLLERFSGICLALAAEIRSSSSERADS